MTPRRRTRKPVCQFCAGVQGGPAYRCPVCGRRIIHHLPTQSEIAADCEAIQRGWRKRHPRPGVVGWEVPEVVRKLDHRVRRDADGSD